MHVEIVPKSTSLSMKTVKNFSMERYLDNQPLEYISEKLSISPTDVETCDTETRDKAVEENHKAKRREVNRSKISYKVRWGE